MAGGKKKVVGVSSHARARRRRADRTLTALTVASSSSSTSCSPSLALALAAVVGESTRFLLELEEVRASLPLAHDLPSEVDDDEDELLAVLREKKEDLIEVGAVVVVVLGESTELYESAEVDREGGEGLRDGLILSPVLFCKFLRKSLSN